MRTELIATSLCASFLVLGLSGTFAKHKGEGPVLERFEAGMSQPLGENNSLSVEVEGFSSDAEVEALRQSFGKGGEDALLSAFHRTTKGHFTMGSGTRMPIRALQSSSGGGVRRLSIIGEAPTVFSGAGSFVSMGHRGFPYTFIQLAVDDQGKGKGTLIPFAKVVFDKEGHLQVISMKIGNVQLVNVHLVR
jgi:hypothetical protein